MGRMGQDGEKEQLGKVYEGFDEGQEHVVTGQERQDEDQELMEWVYQDEDQELLGGLCDDMELIGIGHGQEMFGAWLWGEDDNQ